MNNLKVCRKCGEEKDRTLFGSHKGEKGNKDGLQPWCKKCSNFATQERKKHNLKTNPKFRIDRRMSKNISRQLKASKNGRSWKDLLGYTVEDLLSHLEKSFRDGMTWDNYGRVWHIDHIIPKSFFIYDNYESEQFKACWSLSNLQPLLAEENRKKNNKVPNPFV